MSVVAQRIDRRRLLVGSAGLVAAALFPRIVRGAPSIGEFSLDAGRARVPIVGATHPGTDVWCYNGHVPGPVLRLPQGQPVRITVENKLAEDTTVHWHGIRLPVAMDGVPGLSQPPIGPGQSFTYAFTPPDAGTFWCIARTKGELR